MESSIVIAPPPAGGARIVRFVALGDSVTVGLGDPMPDGSWRGWASLLAGVLADAGRGSVPQPRPERRPRGRCRRPAAGRRAAAPAAPRLGHRRRQRHVAGRRSTRDAIGRGAAPRRGHAARQRRASCSPHGCPTRADAATARVAGPPAGPADAGGQRASPTPSPPGSAPATSTSPTSRRIYDRRMWSIDRLHPSERGHRLLAGCLADGLADARLSGAPAARRRAHQPGADPPRPGLVDGHPGHRPGCCAAVRT